MIDCCYQQHCRYIHHVLEKDHWVTSSVTGGQVLLYDADIYQPLIREGMLAGTIVPVQQQAGGWIVVNLL